MLQELSDPGIPCCDTEEDDLRDDEIDNLFEGVDFRDPEAAFLNVVMSFDGGNSSSQVSSNKTSSQNSDYEVNSYLLAVTHENHVQEREPLYRSL